MASDPVERGTELAEAALAGDRRALARVLTAIENRTPVAEAALRLLYPRAGRAHLVGITGPPGSGKSTLVAALIAELRRADRSVAVVAVDPSSPITGGAILGDRVRMQAYAGDRDVFIRSMAARGHAGGLASTTGAACAVLDAVGFELVLVETVGTGQSEVEVALVGRHDRRPRGARDGRRGPGDQGRPARGRRHRRRQQGRPAGRRHGRRPSCGRCSSRHRSQRRGAGQGSADPPRPRPKRPEVMITTAATGAGVAELLAALDRRRPAAAAPAGDGPAAAARLARADAQVRAILAERIAERLRTAPLADAAAATVRAVADHELDPFTAADRLLGSIGREDRA